MENIIKKANDGGYMDGKLIRNPHMGWGYMNEEEKAGEGEYVNGKKFILPPAFVLHSPERMVLDPLFWQSLGKACGWNTKNSWLDFALYFYRINHTKGWDKAVEWLNKLISK